MGINTENHSWTMQRMRVFGVFSLKWDIFTIPLILSLKGSGRKRKRMKKPEIVGNSKETASPRYNRNDIYVNSQRL